tara:strand:- start:23278 stop:23790 length:513 start_codon:yes stop_codon:yes gene_type:complete
MGKSWSHKQAFFLRNTTRILNKCQKLADERGAEYDTNKDSFMEAPTIFLTQVENRPWAKPKDKQVATRLAVLADVKVQRILSGKAKEDSYLDLINYLAALTGLMFPEAQEAVEDDPILGTVMDGQVYVRCGGKAQWMDLKDFNQVSYDLPQPGASSISEFTRLSGEYPDK